MPDTTHVPGPYRFTTVAHASHRVLGPVSESVIEHFVRHAATLAQDVEGSVLDIGCGKGEWLVRALEHTGGSGLGIEPNPAFAEAARLRIADCALDATVVEAAWGELSPTPDGAALAICTGSLHAFGGYADALRALHSVVAPGGVALLGPGYWKQTPDAEYLAALGASADEMHDWPGTLAQATAAGWHVRGSHVSTLVATWGRDTLGFGLLLLQRD